jgi:hypothetical protein
MENEEIISQDDLREIGREAANEAAKVTRDLMNGDVEETDEELYDESEDFEQTSSLTPKRTIEQIKAHIAEQESFDIFTDVGEELAKSGIFVNYVIKKGGKLFTHEDHPYSWKRLQEDRGEGTYTVIARDQHNKYIKTQTQSLTHLVDKKGNVIPPNQAANQGSNNQPSTLELIALMEAKSKEIKEEARAEAKERQDQFTQMLSVLAPKKDDDDKILTLMMNNSKENITMLQTMITAMKPEDKSSDTTNMMLEMQKSNMMMMKEMQTQTTTLIDKMNDKFERGLERVADLASHEPEKPEFSSKDVMDMVNEAEQRGEDRMKTLFDLVEHKADEKAKFLADKPGDTLTDSLLKSLGPIFGAMMAKPGVVPTTTTPPPVRRSLPPTERRTSHAQGKKPPQKLPTSSSANRVRPGSHSRPNPKKAPSALDYLNDGPESNVDSNAESAKIEQINVANRDKIIETAIPILVQSVQAGKDLTQTVTETIEALEINGIDPQSVEKDVKPEVIEQLIEANKLPEDFQALLREFYVRLIDATRETTR